VGICPHRRAKGSLAVRDERAVTTCGTVSVTPRRRGGHPPRIRVFTLPIPLHTLATSVAGDCNEDSLGPRRHRWRSFRWRLAHPRVDRGDVDASKRGLGVRFITNTPRKTRSDIVRRLEALESEVHQVDFRVSCREKCLADSGTASAAGWTSGSYVAALGYARNTRADYGQRRRSHLQSGSWMSC